MYTVNGYILLYNKTLMQLILKPSKKMLKIKIANDIL
jgi:hypothetical protein